MRDMGRDVEYLTRTDNDFSLQRFSQPEVEGTFHDVGDLLVVMTVAGNDGPFVQEDLGNHHGISRHESPANGVGNGLPRKRVPRDMARFRGRVGHGPLGIEGMEAERDAWAEPKATPFRDEGRSYRVDPVPSSLSAWPADLRVALAVGPVAEQGVDYCASQRIRRRIVNLLQGSVVQ